MDKSTYLEQLYKPYNPCLQNRWLTSSSSIELQKHKFHSFSPHQLKSSVVNCCTFRKNFQITFVFVVQGRYARIYYLNSISLIPNWGERRKPRMQSISCWAQLSFSFVSKQPSKVQDKRILFNGEDMWREVEGEGEGGVDNVLHLSGASSPCSPLSSRLILRILVNSGGQINSLFEQLNYDPCSTQG